jgi:hypothetical protein
VNIFLLLQRIGLLKSKSPVFKENKPFHLSSLQNLNVCNVSKTKAGFVSLLLLEVLISGPGCSLSAGRAVSLLGALRP